MQSRFPTRNAGIPKQVLLLIPLLLAFFYLAYGAPDAVHFAVIGDMGCGCDAQAAVAEEMIEWQRSKPFSFVLTTGDNIYPEDFSRLWKRRLGGDRSLFVDRFDRYYNPLRNRGILFFATLGNHDLETRQGRDLISDRKRFNILSNSGYYYFSPEPKLVTFVALNTNSLLAQNSIQIHWLQKALSESKSIWKIVYGHHPLYSAGGGHPADLILRKALEKILVQNGVNIYLAGHNHFYARMKPQHGIIHFTTGGGGRSLRTPQRNSEVAVVARSYHFMHFDVYEDKVDYWAVPIQGKFLDQGSIHISVR
jgi:Calcineurin-like phosphoesterase